jgi:rhodanese-related sulfurtransferase
MTMLFSLALTLLLAPAPPRETVEFTEDALETVQKNIAKEKAVLVDVRSKEEWDEGYIEGAIFLPVTSLRKYAFDATKLAETLPPKKEKIILYTHCVVGMRAKEAAKILEREGYIVRALHPGYDELIEFGFKKAAERPAAETKPQ